VKKWMNGFAVGPFNEPRQRCQPAGVPYVNYQSPVESDGNECQVLCCPKELFLSSFHFLKCNKPTNCVVYRTRHYTGDFASRNI